MYLSSAGFTNIYTGFIILGASASGGASAFNQ